MKIIPAKTGSATYCPEDNKLRLYVGRVPRDEYEALRAEGWTSTPKQDCDFVATWTPAREDTAIAYGAGELEDEDQSPADRAADRAERFAGYREKRLDEATGHADRYDAGPQVHGYQNAALAERRAARRDVIGTRAVTQWEKAEYWQHRTAGVISHALHVSTPGVRMGRIKELEAEIRKAEKDAQETAAKNQATWDIWNGIAGNGKLIYIGAVAYTFQVHEMKPAGADGKWTVEQLRLGMALMMNNQVHTEYGSERYKLQKANEAALIDGTMKPEDAGKMWIANHPERPKDWDGNGGRWLNHARLRLAYENQMLEAQGGRAAFVEMEAGGWIGKHQIQKVNKSPATGRVVSVQVWGTHTGFTRESNYTVSATRPCLITLNIERMKSEVYRAPTDEERAQFAEGKKAAKEARGVIPTINPTREEAERLQAQWNADASEMDKGKNYPRAAGEVEEMTQAKYSGTWKDSRAIRELKGAKVRIVTHYDWQSVESVVILTDKPQKAFPASVWRETKPANVQPELLAVG